MIRNIDINEISDGNRYSSNDMVKISCNDCKGCSSCCHDMGDSIILDPYDIYVLQKALNRSFESLLNKEISLRVVDYLITPHITMIPGRNCCAFLSDTGRCTIHDSRPGYCRLFPLGRIYENDSFSYFHQTQECTYENKSKIKIKKWLGISNLASYEQYILHYHNLTHKMVEAYGLDENEATAKSVNMLWLNTMFVNPYDIDASFYDQYYERTSKLGITI